jgi:hypothetical protein
LVQEPRSGLISEGGCKFSSGRGFVPADRNDGWKGGQTFDSWGDNNDTKGKITLKLCNLCITTKFFLSHVYNTVIMINISANVYCTIRMLKY